MIPVYTAKILGSIGIVNEWPGQGRGCVEASKYTGTLCANIQGKLTREHRVRPWTRAANQRLRADMVVAVAAATAAADERALILQVVRCRLTPG
jgi:hypothetical protein